jgi:hypothetical protein
LQTNVLKQTLQTNVLLPTMVLYHVLVVFCEFND